MIEPTKRDEEVYALLLSNRGRVTDLAAYREELLVASAQSAEPQEAEDDSAIWEDIKQELNETNCSDIQFLRIKGKVDALRARLASKPSRSEGWTGKPCPKCEGTGIDDPEYDTRSCSSCGGTGEEYASARPSREEEMRTVLAEIERYARASLCDHRGGSPDVGSCPNCKSYLHIIELARAALAQGGARDEAQNV